MKFAVAWGYEASPFVAPADPPIGGRGTSQDFPMHYRPLRWVRHNTILSVSSLVWMAAASAPLLAQGENQNQAPPAAATPQPAVSPAEEPAQPQGGAAPAPTSPPEATPAPQPAAGN